MDFKESKSIARQIADRLCDEILAGTYAEEQRIPSVREYAAQVEVNVNTMVRAYECLQAEGCICMKRGIGYFVAAGARKGIIARRREIFMENELNEFFHHAYLLGFTAEDMATRYTEYVEERRKNKEEQTV